MEEPTFESNTLRQGQEKIKTTVLNFSQNILNFQQPDDSCHFTMQDCSFNGNQKQQLAYFDNNAQIDDSMKDISRSHNKQIQIQQVKSQISQNNLNINIQNIDQHHEIYKLNKEDSSSYSPIQLSPSPNHIQTSQQVMNNKRSSSSLKETLKQQNSQQKQSEMYDQGFKTPSNYNSTSPRITNLNKFKADGLIQTIKYVRRFINKLKLSSKKVLFRNISKPQFQIINDITSDYDYYLFEGYVQNLKLIIYHKKDSIIRLIWDIFIIAFTFYLILVIPIAHLIQFQDESFLHFFHYKCVQWILGIETFLNLNSVLIAAIDFSFLTLLFSKIQEVYLHGVIIRDRKAIFQSNFKNFLQISQKRIQKENKQIFQINRKDLIILVLYTFSQSYNGSYRILSYLDYLAFVKYLDIPQKVIEFETKLQLNDSIKNWMKLLKLEIKVLILVHVTCCIFLNIGQYEQKQNQDSWLNKFDLSNSTIEKQYFSSLYFMIITICTIGYGDISPYTFYERLFIMMVAILSTNITAYTFSQISEIVKFEDNKNESFNKLMTGINYQMKVGGLSMKLQQKVRKFYEYFYIQSQHSKSFANQFMKQLPQNLQEEVLLDLNRENINSIILFKNLSQKCQEQISLQIKQKQFMPGEIILEEKELNNSLYFVNDGNLEIFSTLKLSEKDDLLGSKFQQLQKKDVFGYEGFLLGEKCTYSVKSQGSSIVSFIDKQVFLEILKQFPTDYEKFLFIKDQTIYGSVNANVYKLKCISCGMTDHQLSQCPYISLSIKYKPQKLINERCSYFRKRKRFCSLLKQIAFLQESAMEAVANNDQALIIEALNLIQSSVVKKSDDEEDIDQSGSSSSLSASMQINKNTIQNLDDLQTIMKDGPQPKRKLSGSQNYETLSSKISSKNNKNYENSSLINRDSKKVSYKIERNGDQDNQSILSKQQSKQQDYSIIPSDNQFNSHEEQKDEPCQKLENQKVFFNDEQYIVQNLLRERKSRTSSLHYSKNTELSPQIDKNNNFENKQSTNGEISTSQKTSIHQIMKVNNSSYKYATSKNFEESELEIIKQTYDERQKKSKQEYKQFQRELSLKIKQQSKPTIEDILSDNNQFQKVVLNMERQKSKSSVQEESPSDKGLFKIIQFIAQGKFKNRKKSVTLDNLILQQENTNNQNQNQKETQILNNHTQNTAQNLEIKNSNKIFNNVVESFQNLTSKRREQQPQVNSTEYQIRCQNNLQDIDMLLVRKQYILMQQKNLIQDYIQLPDNEIDIDSLHNYLYYYKSHNANNVIFKYNQKRFFVGRRSILTNRKRNTNQKKRQSKFLYTQIQKLNYPIKQ